MALTDVESTMATIWDKGAGKVLHFEVQLSS
jgi:hypothetical protein